MPSFSEQRLTQLNLLLRDGARFRALNRVSVPNEIFNTLQSVEDGDGLDPLRQAIDQLEQEPVLQIADSDDDYNLAPPFPGGIKAFLARVGARVVADVLVILLVVLALKAWTLLRPQSPAPAAPHPMRINHEI